ncbi:DUF1800 domain-containing protein [Nocardioides taihuensis]|uniref:DUF1800 domain-containing protein n=1 Tax=Nocardioides taihuensis TaxID=1835606 RepID=A0ABW0BIJ0_9ACTN
MTDVRTSGGPSRRTVLGGATAVGAAGAVTAAGLGGAAHAAATPVRARSSGPRLLSPEARHLVGRLSYGLTPDLADRVRRAGGARAWFEAQLDPSSVADPGTARLIDWWDGLTLDAATLWERQVTGVEGGWVVMADYERWTLLRRMRSRRQVLEVMTEFWEHHFNVPATGDAAFTHRVPYGREIRKRALGTFEDLLRTAVLHPAMLIYLNNADSTKKHPNENLGRELLELHTVGRENHTEDDVKSSARILTGYRVDLWDTWAPYYNELDHWTGPVQVLGFSDPNPSSDGRALARRYLSFLAHHPATAQRIARKLAVKFVRDDPSDALVDRLASVYLAHGTAIKPVLRALVKSPEFADSVGAKVRDPNEDVVATYRVLGIELARPTADNSGANAVLWQAASLGNRPFGWPRPDGQPVDNVSWSSPSRLIASMSLHRGLSAGWWPTVDTTYRAPTDWAPSFPVRFDHLVEHVSRLLLHRPASRTLLEACLTATGCSADEQITADHPIMRWRSWNFLTTFLDSPAFLRR